MWDWTYKKMDAAYKKQSGISKPDKSLAKVKLPKDAAETLDLVFNLYSNSLSKADMLHATKKKAWLGTFNALNELDPDLMMEALVLGYEAECTQEEKARNAYDYFVNKGLDEAEFWSYREGARQMARALGFNYSWLEPDGRQK